MLFTFYFKYSVFFNNNIYLNQKLAFLLSKEYSENLEKCKQYRLHRMLRNVYIKNTDVLELCFKIYLFMSSYVSLQYMCTGKCMSFPNVHTIERGFQLWWIPTQATEVSGLESENRVQALSPRSNLENSSETEITVVDANKRPKAQIVGLYAK